jgi:predicted ATP-grasp superfamily ATP-dependent carboligase
MRVLVLTSATADDRKTIAAVRALGERGVHVTVGADRTRVPPAWSRYCRGILTYPDPSADIDRFADHLLEEVAHRRFDVLLPLCDYTTAAIVLNCDRFEKHASLAVPTPEARKIAQDKFELAGLAGGRGIPTPQTWSITSAEEAAALAGKLQYPCVVKYRMGAGGAGLRFPGNRAELLACFNEARSRHDTVFDNTRLLVQEYIPGETHDVCALACHGEPRALVSQRRLGMYPPEGGSGIDVETTDSPELKSLAATLLGELGWHGPAQVEFRVDSRDGSPRLIEVNTRFWGTLDLAIRAGVNFPYLACVMALEGDVVAPSSYRVGLRYRWTFSYALKLLRERGRFWSTLRDYFLPRRGVCSDFQIRDPLPNVAQGIGAINGKRGPVTYLRRQDCLRR